jgi:light-regulated signal transduction histidine kinase (bacteriophytochrome)
MLKDSTNPRQAIFPRLWNEQGMKAQSNRGQNGLAVKIHELARWNDNLEQFAYAASHDLQEHLRMVAAYTQFLSERYRGKLDAEADKYMRHAVDGTTRMRMLIRDLLAFSVAGRPGTELRATDCGAVLRSALIKFTAAMDERGARIKCGDLPVVMSNATQLQQVFQELIGNAIKFRSFESPAIQISAQQHNEEWIFSVSDHGLALCQSTKNPFSSFSSACTPARNMPVTELDWRSAKKIIERHRETIWTESPPQRGTNFKFTLLAVKPELVNATQLKVAGLNPAANAS